MKSKNGSAQRCKHIKNNGDQCRAPRTRGGEYCFWHDPSKAAERAAAQRTGGLNNNRSAVLPPDTANLAVGTAEEVVGLLGVTIDQVRVGLLDARVANTIGYLSGVLLRALDVGELQRRVAALEDVINHQRRDGQSLLDADTERLFMKAGRDATLSPECATLEQDNDHT